MAETLKQNYATFSSHGKPVFCLAFLSYRKALNSVEIQVLKAHKDGTTTYYDFRELLKHFPGKVIGRHNILGTTYRVLTRNIQKAYLTGATRKSKPIASTSETLITVARSLQGGLESTWSIIMLKWKNYSFTKL